MCLDRVEKRHKPALKGPILAWKVLKRVRGRDRRYLRIHMDRETVLVPRRWRKDQCLGYDIIGTLARYRQGFHVWETRAAARRWKARNGSDARAVVVRVRVRRIHTIGWQAGAKVLVAWEEMIL